MSKIHVSRDRRVLGQYDPQTVADGLLSGEFRPDDLAWTEGMDEWKPLGTITTLPAPGADLPPPPPVPTDGALLADPDGMETAEYIAQDVPPWEKREDLGLMTAALQTIYSVFAQPVSTFRNMKRTGGLFGPWLFYYPVSVICGLVNVFFTLAWIQILPASWLEHYGENPAQDSLMTMASTVAMLFFLNLFMPFAMAGMYHVVLKVIAKTSHTYETTFRVYCYVSGALAAVGLIPLPPVIAVQMLYGFAVLVLAIVYFAIALREAHRTTTAVAVVCSLMPLVLMCVCIAAISVAAAGLIGAMAGAAASGG